jgi:hypothetical protein
MLIALKTVVLAMKWFNFWNLIKTMSSGTIYAPNLNQIHPKCKF